MSKHRKTTARTILLEHTSRVIAGLAIGTGVLIVGSHVIPASAHVSVQASDFRHVEDEGVHFSGKDRVQIDAAVARSAAIAAHRADRSRRAKIEAERPRWSLPLYSSIVSPFGYRWGRFHSGVDFAAGIGTPVHAAGDGVVTYPGDGTAGYGIVMVIAHPDGASTWYCHLNGTVARVGQRVKAGDVIGYSGATGNVTGPHLHFEVRFANTPVDPVPWLRHHGLSV